MKTQFYSLILGMAVLLCGCETPIPDNSNEPPKPGERTEIRISGSIEGLTRAGDTAFETNDRIGLTVVLPEAIHADNVAFTYGEAGFTAAEPVYWYEDIDLASELYAYYPWKEGHKCTVDFTFDVASDQSTVATYAASDLLMARTAGIKPSTSHIPLNFTHKLSQLRVHIKNNLPDEAITGVRILNTITTAAVTASTQQATAGTAEPQAIVPLHLATPEADYAASYKAVVVPQQALLTVEVTTSARTVRFDVTETTTFASGRRYDARLTLDEDVTYITIDDSIDDWEQGDDVGFNDGITIADANFKAYCVANFDTDGNGRISEAEAFAVERITCASQNIVSLDGIKFFQNVKYLDCAKNRLKDLDCKLMPFLEYLDCSGNLIEELKLRGNAELISLNCSNNKLTALNVDANTKLQTLDCSTNQIAEFFAANHPSITSVNFDSNTALQTLVMQGSPQLASVKYSSCSKLTTLNLKNCSSLVTQSGTFADSSSSIPVTINLSGTAIRTFSYTNSAPNNSTLDLSNCKSLTSVKSYYWTYGHSTYSIFHHVNLSGCDALRSINELYISGSTLDLTTCTALETIDLEYSGSITALDLSHCKKLKSFEHRSASSLQSLNLSDNPELTSLTILEMNRLSSLDLTSCINLQKLECKASLLTTLDLSKNTKLTNLSCSSCPQLRTIYVWENWRQPDKNWSAPTGVTYIEK